MSLNLSDSVTLTDYIASQCLDTTGRSNQGEELQ